MCLGACHSSLSYGGLASSLLVAYSPVLRAPQAGPRAARTSPGSESGAGKAPSWKPLLSHTSASL